MSLKIEEGRLGKVSRSFSRNLGTAMSKSVASESNNGHGSR